MLRQPICKSFCFDSIAMNNFKWQIVGVTKVFSSCLLPESFCEVTKIMKGLKNIKHEISRLITLWNVKIVSLVVILKKKFHKNFWFFNKANCSNRSFKLQLKMYVFAAALATFSICKLILWLFLFLFWIMSWKFTAFQALKIFQKGFSIFLFLFKKRRIVRKLFSNDWVFCPFKSLLKAYLEH